MRDFFLYKKNISEIVIGYNTGFKIYVIKITIYEIMKKEK